MVPEGKSVLCCDFTGEENGDLWSTSDADLIQSCLANLQQIGVLKKEDVLSAFVKRFPRFYPRYDLQYKETTTRLYQALSRYDNFLSTGRIGFYNYNNSDHCVDMGHYIAEQMLNDISVSDIWAGLEKRVSLYQIVD